LTSLKSKGIKAANGAEVHFTVALRAAIITYGEGEREINGWLASRDQQNEDVRTNPVSPTRAENRSQLDAGRKNVGEVQGRRSH
jgi:hypothetical protein